MNISTRKDYFWNSIGVLAQNAISPILLIIVTRVNGVYDSGVFSYAFAVALIFWAFAVWGGRTYQVSDLRREFSDHSYVMVRVLLGAVVLIGSLLFCLTNGYDLVKTSIIIAFVVFKTLESIADAVYGVLQAGNRLYIAGKSLFIKAMLGTATFVCIDVITGNLLWAVLSLTVVNMVVFLIYDLHYARKLGYYLSDIFSATSRYAHEAMTIIKRCAPIATVLFLSMFSLNIPRYFLDMHHPDEIGHFGILVMPITVLALAITFLLQPKIIYLSELFVGRKYDEFTQVIRRIVYIVLLLGAMGVILAYFVGVPVLNFVFGLDFSLYLSALLVVVLGAIANGVVSVYVNVFTIIRHFKALFYTLVLTNLCLVAFSAVIVDQYGLLGATGLFAGINLLQAVVLIVSYRALMGKYISDNIVS